PQDAAGASVSVSDTLPGTPGTDPTVLADRSDVRIDPEFASLLPPLTREEARRLKENLLADGFCHDSLVVWKEHDLLLGGHHRLPILKEHGIPFDVVEIDLPDREAAKNWIIKDQLGKRNLTPAQRDYYLGKLYQAEKQPHGGARGQGASVQSEHLKTAESLAEKFRTSPSTVRRSEKFAQDVDQLAAKAGAEVRQQILSGPSGLTR